MAIEEIRAALAWSCVINYAFLLYWFAMFVYAHDWMYGFHHRWFALSKESFDAINYGLMGAFKLGILLLNLTPYLALRILA